MKIQKPKQVLGSNPLLQQVFCKSSPAGTPETWHREVNPGDSNRNRSVEIPISFRCFLAVKLGGVYGFFDSCIQCIPTWKLCLPQSATRGSLWAIVQGNFPGELTTRRGWFYGIIISSQLPSKVRICVIKEGTHLAGGDQTWLKTHVNCNFERNWPFKNALQMFVLFSNHDLFRLEKNKKSI